MPETAVKPDDGPVAMEALNEIVEAWLDFAGNKQSRQYLRSLAARVAIPVDGQKVVALRPEVGAQTSQAAKAWLQQQLPGWLSRYG